MKYKVIRTFLDRADGRKRYEKGQDYETKDEERTQHLLSKGLIEASSQDSSSDGIISLGGGYFQLPNGEKVRGRENAQKALEELVSLSEAN